ncbi:DUF58 domain-containing protein [Lederbergia wuyishanensis]|uniref:DUF58 domain-containing protein n=1 Tax=Lederbergia wuyishanensis TaxID=1347903 RepID=A0ABU0CZ76_9BACI|nr:DUF58 domain-containing protein [Lederbergia wuyishanensis]MCJ8006072.1 DUF58 domain-containing protein [Lederbergia wuyishanensis]MDQ0341441.1 hypothetical protein [Lederbergia wuyishanensis]
MKQWFRNPSPSNRVLNYLPHILLLLIIISFFANQIMMMFIFLTSLMILNIQSYYIKIVGNRLDLIVVKEKNFLVVDDEGNWKITLVNTGFPILKANFTITFDESVTPLNAPYNKTNGLIEVIIPFFIWKNEEKEIVIPVIANKRGKSQIREVTVRIPHLFGSGYVDLEYQNHIPSQILVYPRRNLVHIRDFVFINKQGLQDVKTSLFIDTMQPIGVRDYTAGDPFQHIHWKASAKLQVLQSKVFSSIASRGWLIIMNISEYYSINAKLEEMIGQTAFLIDYALKEEIPFSLAVNVRSFGNTPFYYLQEGFGSKHRQAAFELLTVLSFSSLLFPPNQMLSQLKKENLPSVVIFIGSETVDIQKALLDLSSTGRSIYEVENVHNKGVLRQWRQKNLAV